MYANDNVRYAQQRLNGTIIRHMGKAVEVIGVNYVSATRPLEISSIEIISGNVISDKIDNYDCTPAPLGFINGGKHLGYAVRKPLRNDWRQGLRDEQIMVPFSTGDGFIWAQKDIAKTIENIFPSIDEIRDEFKGRKKGMKAWCREFSFDEKEDIYYRAFGKVGNFIKGTKEFLLDAKFFWVEERLKEVV